MGILVSINCITYNHEKYIGDAIESFLKQKTTFNYEIVIGDDCSTDSTRSIIEKYIKKYPEKIRLISSEKNVGMMKNERRVYEASRGKYIAECEGDDFWIDSNKLQKQVDYMESHPECTFCFHNAYRSNMYGDIKEPMLAENIEERDYNCEEMIELGFIPTASRMYKKEAMKEVPNWYENSVVGDYPSQLIISYKGYAHYIKDIMSVYRMGVKNSATQKLFGKNNSNDKRVKSQKDFLLLLDNFNVYSDYKFDKQIQKRKMLHKFFIYKIKCDINVLKSDEYKDFYNSLCYKDKIGLYIERYMPYVYRFVLRIYELLKAITEKNNYIIHYFFKPRRII